MVKPVLRAVGPFPYRAIRTVLQAEGPFPYALLTLTLTLTLTRRRGLSHMRC